MPQAEHILEKVALNEVSPLPWRWKNKDEDGWLAKFMISDDSGTRRGVEVVFHPRGWGSLQPGYELKSEWVKNLGDRLHIPDKLLTKTPPAQVGPEGISLLSVVFWVGGALDKNQLPKNVSFIKTAPRLFATVADVVRTYVKENKPDVLFWEPNTATKASIYMRIMKREKVSGYVGWSGTKFAGYLRVDSQLAK